MFQRSISILVLIGLLASQLARTPHSHTKTSPAHQREHDARPHVHIGLTHHVHKDGYSHAGHRDDRRAENSSQTFDPTESIELRGLSVDHDRDAVYLAGSTISIATRGDRFVATVASAVPLAAGNSWTQGRLDALAALNSFHPPDPNGSEVKLFLKLRNLRI